MRESTTNDRTRPVALLREPEAAAFLGLTQRALQKRRADGDGPPFIRISSRCVRYAIDDLKSWLESCKRTTTKDPRDAKLPAPEVDLTADVA